MKNLKAFPKTSVNQHGEVLAGSECGMDLRDYFAGKYLQGHLASEYFIGTNTKEDNITRVAKSAYLFADALIKARYIKNKN